MGLFSSIGNVLGTVAKVAGNVVPGPGGFVLRQVGGALQGGGGSQAAPATFGNPGTSTFVPTAPTTARRIGGVGPTAAPAPVVAGAAVTGGACITPGGLRGRWTVKNGAPHCKAIRRQDPLNRKALRRGRRRSNRFVDIAKDELKAQGLKVSRSGSTRSRRDLGPGHTHTR